MLLSDRMVASKNDLCSPWGVGSGQSQGDCAN